MNLIKKQIIELAQSLRVKAKEKMEKYDIDQSRPVASWISDDRLLSGVGYEFTVILRTCGCKWAKSASGGCSMCGYYNDSSPVEISDEEIVAQFIQAIGRYDQRLQEIHAEGKSVALKIFTSGSFFDDDEISEIIRDQIASKITELPMITEIVVESRPEFVVGPSIQRFKKQLGSAVLEVGMGLESSSNFVRETLINKGFGVGAIKKAIDVLHENDALAKIYLLLKPPFLTEKRAIVDAVQSIKDSLEMGADVISINPVNVQKYTIVDYLHYRNQYRPPWIYSVFEVFRRSLNPEILKNVLILCDPSAAGKSRGVHNCKDRGCNQLWLDKLHEFVQKQDYSIISDPNLPYDACSCWKKYQMVLDC